jgi:hypothetical protein
MELKIYKTLEEALGKEKSGKPYRSPNGIKEITY